MAAIKGELYVDYNGSMTRTHLTTEAELVEGLQDAVEGYIGQAHIKMPSTDLISMNTIYPAGTMVIEENTGYFKIADGSTPYNDLEYLNGRNGALNGLIVEVKGANDEYDEKGIDDVILELME